MSTAIREPYLWSIRSPEAQTKRAWKDSDVSTMLASGQWFWSRTKRTSWRRDCAAVAVGSHWSVAHWALSFGVTPGASGELRTHPP